MQIPESLRRMHLDVVSLLVYYRRSYDYNDHNAGLWLHPWTLHCLHLLSEVGSPGTDEAPGKNATTLTPRRVRIDPTQL